MKRQLLFLLALLAFLVGMPIHSVDAAHGVGRGHGGARFSSHGHRHAPGLRSAHKFGRGIGIGGFGYDDSDFADLYRELRKNLPYFALHPPVYYSYPVPRTYGYSPFAYLPTVMTPEVAPEPLEIINPHVPPKSDTTPAQDVSDRSADAGAQPQPLVIINPYAAPNRSVAQSNK